MSQISVLSNYNFQNVSGSQILSGSNYISSSPPTLLNLLRTNEYSYTSKETGKSSLYNTYRDGLTLGSKNPTSGSKSLKYNDYAWGDEGPLLGDRVSWDISDENANPTLEYGSENLLKDNTIDAFIRGGWRQSLDRRLIDVKRMSKFLTTPQGRQFIAKQVLLQVQNPRKPKAYNLGINTLQQIALAGFSNVPRGGALSLGGWQVGSGIVKTDYEGDIGRNNVRWRNYGLGDPGRKSTTQGLWNQVKQTVKETIGFKTLKYNQKLVGKTDLINALPILRISQKPDDFEKKTKDFVKFRFEVVDHDKNRNNLIIFRAFLDSIGDDYSAQHNSFKYNGRGEPFYTYKQFDRKISLSFKIAAQSRGEMRPIYQKLNYLVAQTAPNYSQEGRIRTPYTYLSVGDWFQRIPGLITSVGLKWMKDYPWEIALDRKQGVFSQIADKLGMDAAADKLADNGQDSDMLVLPHVLDVSLSFQPLHGFTPNNLPTTPFIGINGDGIMGHTNFLEDVDENGKVINNGDIVYDKIPEDLSSLEEMGQELLGGVGELFKELSGAEKDILSQGLEAGDMDHVLLETQGIQGLQNSMSGFDMGGFNFNF